MNLHDFPKELALMLEDYDLEKDEMGCSSAGVYRCRAKDGGGALYLKVSGNIPDAEREHTLIEWLGGKLPVPKVIYWKKENGHTYLLMTEAKGYMTCDAPAGVVMPAEKTGGLYADGILMLQGIDISDCPVDMTLDVKLKIAKFHVDNGMVDMDDWDGDNDFESPQALYEWLESNRPREELVFSHGDYCMPNVFIDGAKVTGFIDIDRGGIADKYQDIALCVRSLRYNLGDITDEQKEGYIKKVFERLGIEPDWAKIKYYTLLDELF
jgi:kanamycin kinase/aminoglycoside 3'-phosphotransferase-3